MIIILIIVYIIISLIIAAFYQDVVEKKGYTETKYFWMCFLFGFAGYLLVIALPNQRKDYQSNSSNKVIVAKDESQKAENESAIEIITHTTTEESVTPKAVELSPGNVQCPKCGKIQPANRLCCWHCGVEFTI